MFIMKKLINAIAPDVQVITYDNPLQALEGLREIPPSLVFFDLNMPQLNGWEMMDEVRQKGMEHSFVLITSSTSHMDKQKRMEYSMIKDYFIKPVSKEQLENTLHSHAIL